MKKTLLFALAAVATIFTSCSSDIINDNDDSNNNQGKGMTLIANVEQTDTRATLDASKTFGTWNFAYTDNDQVSVGNDKMDNKYYTFTKSGDNFSCADAKATSTAANWYAYYPSTTIDLTNQKGTVESAAQFYALAGATETATTGSDGLTINMAPKAAVLRIVKVDNYGPCDIFLKTTGDKFVKGLKAKKNEAGYEVETSESQVSVFKKESKGNAGIYYVIVPAGVYLEVWNDTKLIKKTKANGLNAGKYYTLTSGPTTGTATATINGETKTIGWVQLYYGGPRFATENVAEEMSWNDAIKTGDEYIWGKYWRTVKKEELDFVEEDRMTPKKENIDLEFSTDNGIKHFKYKGIQPGYNSNEMIIPFTKGQNEAGVYWTSSTTGKTNDKDQLTGTCFTITDWYGAGIVNFFTDHERHVPYTVRPVLTISTVLWGEQNIK